MYKSAIIFIVAIFCAVLLNAQQKIDSTALDRCKQEVEKIDGQALYKVYVRNINDYAGGDKGYILLGDVPSLLWMHIDYSSEHYYDSSYRLRKHIYRVGYPDYNRIQFPTMMKTVTWYIG